MEMKPLCGATTVHFAAFSGQIEMLEPLAQAGCQLDEAPAKRGDEPASDESRVASRVHMSIRKYTEKKVSEPVKPGYMINEATPLHFACLTGRLPMLEHLAACECDINKCATVRSGTRKNAEVV